MTATREKEQRFYSRPRIILIGGSWSSGKSTTAIRLAYDLGIANVIHTDVLRSCLRVSLSGEDKKVVSLATYEAWQYAGLQCDEKTLSIGFYRQCEIVRTSVEQCIREAIDFGKDTIIEGLHLHPALYAYIAHRICSPFVWLNYADEEFERLLRKRCRTTYKGRSASRYLDGQRQNKILLLNRILFGEAKNHCVYTINIMGEDVIKRLRLLAQDGAF